MIFSFFRGGASWEQLKVLRGFCARYRPGEYLCDLYARFYDKPRAEAAEYADVSYQTVSCVINQAAHVSEKTCLKLEMAMSALNYIPNRMAQQLASKLSHTLGFATSNLTLHALSQIVAAAKSRASELHFNVVISMTEQPGLEATKAAVSQLLSRRVDGILVNIPMEAEHTQVEAPLEQTRYAAASEDGTLRVRVNRVSALTNELVNAVTGQLD